MSTENMDITALLDFLAGELCARPFAQRSYPQAADYRVSPVCHWWLVNQDRYPHTPLPRWLQWTQKLKWGQWPSFSEVPIAEVSTALACYPSDALRKNWADLRALHALDGRTRLPSSCKLDNVLPPADLVDSAHDTFWHYLSPAQQQLFDNALLLEVPWYDAWAQPRALCQVTLPSQL